MKRIVIENIDLMSQSEEDWLMKSLKELNVTFKIQNIDTLTINCD